MALSTGERIRLYRTRRGLSRERLTGLAGVSPSWLKQVENGTRKADSLRLLVAVAEALNMPVWDLIAGPRRLAPDGGPQDEAMTRLEHALLPRVFRPQDAAVPDLASVRAELDETWVVRYSGRFGEAAERLAALIGVVEAAVRHYRDGADARLALELYADVHWLTAYTLFRAGERGEHSRIAADRFVAAARRVGDPLLMAASARCLGHVLLHLGEAAAAGTADEDYLSVYGALLLAGALAAARLGDGTSCRRLLAEAEKPAQRVGDVDRYHMTFGPTNLLIHAVSCARELGDFGEVIRVGRQLDTSRLPPELVVRRAQVQLDMATAYEHLRQDEAAVLRLLEADRTAPQFIRNSAVAREIVRAILRRPGGRSIPGLLDLAGRVGALLD